MILRHQSSISPHHLYYSEISHYWLTQIDIASYGAAQKQLSNKILEDLLFVFPPLPEQTQIADFLDTKTQQIDDLISKEQRKIELLKEYRQSLISDAITGKIDVRDAV